LLEIIYDLIKCDFEEHKMDNLPPFLEFRRLYDHFDSPVTEVDCGVKCAPLNPNKIPFCCDICHAVPAAYHQEWEYLRSNTDLWHPWRRDECPQDPDDPDELRAELPGHMVFLACQGPADCQRQFRAVSCRQFPFFPFITSDDRFIGLAYEWKFEETCWVIRNLAMVTSAYRKEFVRFYDELLSTWDEEFEGYANLSDEMRQYFAEQKRRIPILHRNGGYYLLSPGSERMQRVPVGQFQRFEAYQGKE
jgi:hypothetical protein